MFRSISAVTYTVPDFDASCQALESHLNYRRIHDLPVTKRLASFWRTPQIAGARHAVFAPASNEPAYIRFVEQAATPGYRPLRTFGWNATELHVRDVHELASSLTGSPFTILGGPRDLLGNGSAIALQVRGPSNEVFYLTEINGDAMQRSYGKAHAPVGRLFIVVLGSEQHDASRHFYAGLTRGSPRARQFPIRVLATAHGLDPLTTRFPIGSAILEDRFRIEIDGYPESAVPRETTSGSLPPGLCMVSFAAASMPNGLSVAQVDGFDFPPYSGRPVSLCHGPDGEWFEVIETATG